MKATLRDVAKKSGLSVTTVSRALNDHDDVAKETKAVVREAAQALGYTPNLAARRLKMQRADAIGLILPNEHLKFSDPFFSGLVSGMVTQSIQHGLELNLTTSLPNERVEDVYLKYINSRRVDGFIVVRIERNDARIQLLTEHNFPFIAFGRANGRNNHAYVDDNSEVGIRLAIDHLIELGHRRIACISEPIYLAKSYHRLQAYRDSLQAHDIPLDPHLIIEGRFRQRSGRLCTLHLLDLDDPPTAIVAVNDLLALGALKAIHERGLEAGKDVSIVGFDDILLAEYAHPPLTTLRQSAQQMGALLCQHLAAIIHTDSAKVPQILIEPTLIIRESTGVLS